MSVFHLILLEPNFHNVFLYETPGLLPFLKKVTTMSRHSCTSHYPFTLYNSTKGYRDTHVSKPNTYSYIFTGVYVPTLVQPAYTFSTPLNFTQPSISLNVLFFNFVII